MDLTLTGVLESWLKEGCVFKLTTLLYSNPNQCGTIGFIGTNPSVEAALELVTLSLKCVLEGQRRKSI